VIPQADWKWFGHAGHLIVGRWCRFHLATQVGTYLVSTVGEYWPERPVREIHAKVYDPQWLAQNSHLRGDDFDHAYMVKFGYEQVGFDRKYETMVFKAGEPCNDPECGCGLPTISGCEIRARGSSAAGEAARFHFEFCEAVAKGEIYEEVEEGQAC
jgi:hypothetical protein